MDDLEHRIETWTDGVVDGVEPVTPQEVFGRRTRRARAGRWTVISIAAAVVIGAIVTVAVVVNRSDETVLATQDTVPEEARPTTSDGAPTTDATDPPAEPGPGGLRRPPDLAVSGGGKTLTLEPWTYCYGNGCADGVPPDPLPDIGSPASVVLDFPLADWSFTATFQRLGEPCARRQTVALQREGPTTSRLRPVGRAGTYQVELFGKGNGDVIAGFEWTTPSDGPMPRPDAQLAVLADNDGKTDTYGIELGLQNLAATPATATATITVTAANGRALTFDAGRAPDPPGSCRDVEGSLSWDGPDDKGLEAAALGPGPFTYDVVVTLDGVPYRAHAVWPGDQIPDNHPSVALNFVPPLPAP